MNLGFDFIQSSGPGLIADGIFSKILFKKSFKIPVNDLLLPGSLAVKPFVIPFPDLMMIEETLTSEQRLLVDQVRQFISKEVQPSLGMQTVRAAFPFI